MASVTGGSRRKSRHKLSKKPRESGKVTITRLLKKFKEGDRVIIKIEPAIHSGMPHARYHGKHGLVVGSQGTNYKVKIKDLNKEKLLIVAPVHISRA